MRKATRTHTTAAKAVTKAELNLIRLAERARAAEARYLTTLNRVPDAVGRPNVVEDGLLARAADKRQAACEAMAATPAATLVGMQAKARVLIDGAVHSNALPPIVHDTDGLIWSLLQDLIGATPPA